MRRTRRSARFWGEQTARRMLAEASFTSVEVHRDGDDPGSDYFIAAKE